METKSKTPRAQSSTSIGCLDSSKPRTFRKDLRHRCRLMLPLSIPVAVAFYSGKVGVIGGLLVASIFSFYEVLDQVHNKHLSPRSKSLLPTIASSRNVIDCAEKKYSGSPSKPSLPSTASSCAVRDQVNGKHSGLPSKGLLRQFSWSFLLPVFACMLCGLRAPLGMPAADKDSYPLFVILTYALVLGLKIIACLSRPNKRWTAPLLENLVWTHRAALFLFGTCYLWTAMILYAGLVWFVLPIMLVAAFKVTRYLCDGALSRPPIHLSGPPQLKRSVIMAWTCTLAFGILLVTLWQHFANSTCPFADTSVLSEWCHSEVSTDSMLKRIAYTVAGHSFTISNIHIYVAALSTLAAISTLFADTIADSAKRELGPEHVDESRLVPTELFSAYLLMALYTNIYYAYSFLGDAVLTFRE